MKNTDSFINRNTGHDLLVEDTDLEKHVVSKNGYFDGEKIGLDPSWKYADQTVINSGKATMYLAENNRKNIVVGLNAGHGTKGGTRERTWCHPDHTAKVTEGTTETGAEMAVAVSIGMEFSDGTPEKEIDLREAQIVKDLLLSRGYDVLMVRDSEDVQLDNVARAVVCNNAADCHISIHWDGDGWNYDRGCHYWSVPDGLKHRDPVSSVWKESERLGESLIAGLRSSGNGILEPGKRDMDLTQTAYSTIPSVAIELGNQNSDHSDKKLLKTAKGLADGIDMYFGQK